MRAWQVNVINWWDSLAEQARWGQSILSPTRQDPYCYSWATPLYPRGARVNKMTLFGHRLNTHLPDVFFSDLMGWDGPVPAAWASPRLPACSPSVSTWKEETLPENPRKPSIPPYLCMWSSNLIHILIHSSNYFDKSFIANSHFRLFKKAPRSLCLKIRAHCVKNPPLLSSSTETCLEQVQGAREAEEEGRREEGRQQQGGVLLAAPKDDSNIHFNSVTTCNRALCTLVLCCSIFKCRSSRSAVIIIPAAPGLT